MTAWELMVLVVQALGWCLVHFIWQAILVGGLYAAVRLLLPRGNARYFAAMLALVALTVVPVLTAFHEARGLAQPVDLGNVLVAAAGHASTRASASGAVGGWLAPLRVALPWLVLLWASGVTFLGGRVFRQWRGLRAMVHAAEALPPWQARAQRLGALLGLGRAIRVLASVRIATPTLVGWVRPVVVLPLAMVARMPVQQIDLILAHELAHLRRFDHVANLFQVVVETLLFYHPVVHWISRNARNERELCCDAMALHATGGSRRDFVAALAGLEQFRSDHADLVLAASGGVLVERAWFIAGAPRQHRGARPGVIGMLAVLLGVAVTVAAWRQGLMHNRIPNVLAVNATALRHDLAAAVRPLPAPGLQAAAAQRPVLEPLAGARTVTPPAIAAPVLRRALRPVTPTISAPDLTVAAMQVRPALLQPGVPGDATSNPAVAATPHAIRTVQPAYPPQALLNGAQGQVEIQFTLDSRGVPQDLKVVHASARGLFDAAAMEALSRWRFDASPTPGRVYRQTFAFRLAGDAADTAADQECVPSTGTHICRHAFDADPGVRVLRPNR